MNESLENNRFEKAYQRIRQNKITVTIVALALLFLVENVFAWSYVAKRSISEQPYIDLLERYFVLYPFKKAFPEQYLFPKDLWLDFKGETSQLDARRALYSADGLLGYRLSPSTVTAESIWTWRGTNAQGLIITDTANHHKEYQIPKPDNVFRIIVLGGSTVESDGATGSTTALPAMLQKVIEARYLSAQRPRSRMEIINAGVGGYFSTQELLLYLSRMRQFQPDLVLSYNGWNDLMFNNDAIQEYSSTLPLLWNQNTDKNNLILNDYYEFWPTLGRAVTLAAQRSLQTLRRIATFQILERGFVQLVDRVVQTTTENSTQVETEMPFFPKSVDRYIDNMEMLIVRNRIDDVPLAWFLQPLVGLGNKPPAEFRERSFYKSSPGRIERRKKFYRIAEQSQQDVAAKYLGDPTVCAASLTDVLDGNSEVVYEDSGHLFDKGNLIVAERITKELAACGIIKEKSVANTK